MNIKHYWHHFRGEPYVLHEEKSKHQRLTVEVNPPINFKGLFSNGKFMAGLNTQHGYPWNSPFFVIDFALIRPKRVLFLGGGPCCAPVALRSRDRKVIIDIVEKDEATISLARKYFGLPRDKSLSIHISDAQKFLALTTNKYDVIFFDIGFTYERRRIPAYVFSSSMKNLTILSKRLSPKGILLFVVIAARSGAQGVWLKEVFTRMRRRYQYVHLFCDVPADPTRVQSYFFWASSHNYVIHSRPTVPVNGWEKMYEELVQKVTIPIYL